MINVNRLEDISSILSTSFFYGFSKGYTNTTIEEYIMKNPHILSLENGDGGFLNNLTIDEIVESIFKQKIEEYYFININPLSLWLGEIYTKLFFYFNKSFSYIFLYLPIKKAIELFPIYHEMDISELLHYFEEETNKKTLLPLLLKKKDFTMQQLASLTNIKYDTIVRYTRKNDYLYHAEFSSIYKIAHILDVNINIFVKKINNFTNSDMFDFDKTNKFIVHS